MDWIYLLIAGLLEIIWALGLKASNGFSRPIISVVTIAVMILSFAFLSLSLRTLPVSLAYAVWTGIGATGTALFGMFYFGESLSPPRILCLALIITGTLGLKFFEHS